MNFQRVSLDAGNINMAGTFDNLTRASNHYSQTQKHYHTIDRSGSVDKIVLQIYEIFQSKKIHLFSNLDTITKNNSRDNVFT